MAADASAAKGGHVGASAEVFADVFYQGADVRAARDVRGEVDVRVFVLR